MHTNIIWVLTVFAMGIAGLSCGYLHKELTPKYKLISNYIWIGILIYCITLFFRAINNYNLFLLPIYSFIELVIFSKLYFTFFIKKPNPLLHKIITFIYILIVLDFLFLCDLFNAETFYAFSKVITDLAIMGLCLNYYWMVLKEEAPINKELLLLNSGFMSYFSINCFIFLSINFLVNESLDLVTPFWVINALSVLFLYLFLTYMIWQHGKIQKISPSG